MKYCEWQQLKGSFLWGSHLVQFCRVSQGVIEVMLFVVDGGYIRFLTQALHSVC